MSLQSKQRTTFYEPEHSHQKQKYKPQNQFEAPTSLQADRHSFWICIFTAWFIYIFKNIESVSFLVFYFEGHYKWFLSNLKHPLLQTYTMYETDRFASKYIEEEIIIAAAPSIKYENTKWICIASNVIIMIFLEVVRIWVMIFVRLHHVIFVSSICCKWFIRLNNQKKYITFANNKKNHICAGQTIQLRESIIQIGYRNVPKIKKNTQQALRFHINAFELCFVLFRFLFCFFVDVYTCVDCSWLIILR